MELKKCPEGHYYDASVNAECPICQQIRMGGGSTIPFDQPQGDSPTLGGFYEVPQGTGATQPMSDGSSKTRPIGATAPYESAAPIGATAPLTGAASMNARSARDMDEGKTIGYITEPNGLTLVVGWLICLNGSQKGRDYRIHTDNNYIGRSEQMDICIRGDESISRTNHAVLAYDSRDKAFYFGASEGRSLVRLNGKAVLTTVELKAYDMIEIGRTKLIFVPLCGEGFDWDNVE